MFLVSVSIGPVQDFIAAARKTQDLAAGSSLLVSLTTAAASTFPAPNGAAVFGVGRIFPSQLGSGGANKILGLVDGDPRSAVENAKAAARSELLRIWNEQTTPGVGPSSLTVAQLDCVDLARAAKQLEALLEINAAWVPVRSAQDYSQARIDVERILAGRKALRDFPQTAGDDARIPNSPLDPTRPSVVNEPGTTSTPQLLRAAPLYLKSSEMLDGVSLLKRLVGQSMGATVLSTRDLAQRSVDPDYGPSSRENEPAYPYYAILVADGDHMGVRLGDLTTPAAHRDFSTKLDEFAVLARDIIDESGGFAVYVGGDDVLGLLPVARVVSCATDLAEFFQGTVGGTLSCGVAVVHYREPLSVGLQRARHAERRAKEKRNQLALALHKRSGQPLIVSTDWGDAALTVWPGWFRGSSISRGLPYRLRTLLDQWPLGGDAEVLAAEIVRIIGRSNPQDTSKEFAARIPRPRNRDELRALVDQMVVARFLAGAMS